MIKGLIDSAIVFRIIYQFSKKWTEWDAYKQGIIDADGKRTTKDIKTPQDKDSYTSFDRMIANLKRLFEKLPYSTGKVASIMSALYLLKEEYKLTDSDVEAIREHIESEYVIDSKTFLNESIKTRLKDKKLEYNEKNVKELLKNDLNFDDNMSMYMQKIKEDEGGAVATNTIGSDNIAQNPPPMGKMLRRKKIVPDDFFQEHAVFDTNDKTYYFNKDVHPKYSRYKNHLELDEEIECGDERVYNYIKENPTKGVILRHLGKMRVFKNFKK